MKPRLPLRALGAAVAAALGLSACVYAPPPGPYAAAPAAPAYYPYYYGPSYYGPPVVGAVTIGGVWGHGYWGGRWR